MHKRAFLGAASALPLLAAAAPASTAASASGPALLTITGQIARTNRGPIDPALDQMMHKQKISFDKGFTFDYGALSALPAITIRPTLEYDGKVHALRGPLLVDVLAAAGARMQASAAVTLRAVDGFAVDLPLEAAKRQRFIVATHLDGKPMALGGLGPLWAVIDADRIADLANKPVNERFGQCPWALYHIDVR
ncbi:MAG: molybdopterin-dependent oxidoreductase [Massilia sp.]